VTKVTTNSLVGLGGYAQTGKDTIADYLAKEYGWVKTYMSRPLETALLKMNPWVLVVPANWVFSAYPKCLAYTAYTRYSELHELVGYEASKSCLDVRDYLQKLGTEIGREMCDPDVWARYAFREVDKYMPHTSVAITGIRFPNELVWVKKREGVLVWVDRPGFGPVNAHASDKTLSPDQFDIRVPNDGTPDDLFVAIDRLVRNDWSVVARG
jgi:hypothetical protein